MAAFAQRDLNCRAKLALLGLSDTPANDIQELLVSEVPIDLDVRRLLATAFDANGPGLKFTVSKVGHSARFKQLLKGLYELRAGRAAKRRAKLAKYCAAKQDLAAVLGRGEKTAAACITHANKVDKWLAQARTRHPAATVHDDYALEIAFIYGKITGTRPEEWIKPSLKDLASFVKDYEDLYGKDRILRRSREAVDGVKSKSLAKV